MSAGELLSKVKKIEIKTRRLVDEITGGAYHSVFKGRGIEFSEVREYTPEDDVRDIDWNVTARMGTPFIKKYSEERELTVMLAVDASASGLFGAGEKDKREQMIEAAALLAFSAIRNNDKVIEAAALLAFSAIRNNDKVGLLIFTDETELYLPPRSGRKHVLRVIRELVAMEPKRRGTDIGKALESLAETLKKKSVIFLVSDFLDDKDYEKSLKIVNRKHDLIAVRVLDDAELHLPKLCGITLEGSESGAVLDFEADTRGVKAYDAAAQTLHDANRETCRRAKVDMVDIRCNEDLVRPLMAFFRTRRGKLSAGRA